MKIRESVLKARSYFSKRDKLLSYADFSNFKQQHLELKRNKKSLEFSRSGSYLNSRDKKIYYHEQYVLTATHKIIVILTSPKQISAIERSEVSNRLREIRKETNIGQKSDMLSPLFVDNGSVSSCESTRPRKVDFFDYSSAVSISLRGAGTNGNISYLNVFILSYAVKV